jgi:hypothetical protein
MNTEQNWITTPVTADILCGSLDVEPTTHGMLPHRLPARARRQIPDDQLAVAEAHPTAVWPALTAARGGVELVNLGFGGGVLLDAFTARAMRDTPA